MLLVIASGKINIAKLFTKNLAATMARASSSVIPTSLPRILDQMSLLKQSPAKSNLLAAFADNTPIVSRHHLFHSLLLGEGAGNPPREKKALSMHDAYDRIFS
ncbi:hypothetical protein [Brevibacillus parabrevis]|uniref:hypothetical protein n=1 Tax=Brevibacillus parabrevis TaxID=54914 RepID=UPI0011450B3C|nr:hypothetical protein [Brevibacillus parabrevis]MBU8713174.1 hypothetical protein [Brevibacillus parabrevis]MED2255672.1 hypothetical protein [Brevibacillus parabrevis]WDV95441.1 hypothetical protein PSE45_28065 [Brevibacillus parabrevis]